MNRFLPPSGAHCIWGALQIERSFVSNQPVFGGTGKMVGQYQVQPERPREVERINRTRHRCAALIEVAEGKGF